jgi:paraquat-inducible protein B
MNKRVSPALIGGFVVSGIVLSVAAVIVFGSGRAFDDTRSYVSFFPGSVNGLTVGSNVSFRGVPIGTVSEVLLAMPFDSDDMGEDMRIPVVFEIDLAVVAERGVTTDLGDDERMLILLERGMSARLDTESLLTGRLYVSLDFRPDTERFVEGGQTEYQEIPTVRSPMAEVGNQLQSLADKFVDMDVEEVFLELRQTLDGVNALLTSDEIQALPSEVGEMVSSLDQTLLSVRDLAVTVDEAIAPMQQQVEQAAVHAEESMSEVDETLDALQDVMDPQAPLMVGLVQTLSELQLAAESLRRVADMIERDPSILVRGRATGGNN